MAAHILEPSDIIPVTHLPVMIYGPPSAGKTSISQTANNPITLDFDRGIHRSAFRKRAVRFDAWDDLLAEQKKGLFQDYDSIVIDTLGAMLDVMSEAVKQEDPKNAQRGGLSIQGWGVLGNRFGQWIRPLLLSGHDVVMVCHEEESKDVNGTRFCRPDMPGKMSYTIVHRVIDLMGHVRYEGSNRFLDFSPSETAIGKNAAQFDPVPVPDLKTRPHFLADLLAEAKVRIGKTSEASAAIAKVTEEWAAKLEADPPLAEFNGLLPGLTALQNGQKKAVWAMLKAHAEAAGWVFDKGRQVFVEGGAA
jgi:hypothetical protein